MIGYVYALWGKDENDIFYIGSSLYPERRVKEHIVDNRYNDKWSGYNLSIIEEVVFEDRKELFDAEVYWIHQFNEWGFKLKNKVKLYFRHRFGIEFKMTFAKAEEIRRSNKSRKELAKEYGISETTIHTILNNKAYKPLPTDNPDKMYEILNRNSNEKDKHTTSQ